MATKDSMSAMPSKSTMTPTGEESVTPVSQPSSLGDLSASMVTKTDRRLEVIQRAQVMYSTPEDDSYSIDFAIDAINCAYPSCTGMYLDVAGHMLAFYGKKTNPRAGLLHDQGVVASKAIADIPTWMGYFAKWRVRRVSVSEASEILAGCKRLEKETWR